MERFLFSTIHQNTMEQMRETTTGPLEGKNIILQRLNLENDYMALYEASHGTPEKEAIFKYLYSHDLKELPPFDSPMKFKEYLNTINSDPTWIQFVAVDKKTSRKIGQINYLNVVPAHERAEIGGLWFTPEFHGTYANKESTLLLLSYMFDRLKWRRVEWKCNSSNMPSRKAALKLGFQFEGIFRNHMLVKGIDAKDPNKLVNRDTAWFSIIDSEWEEKKQALFDMLNYSEQDKIDFLTKMRSRN